MIDKLKSWLIRPSKAEVIAKCHSGELLTLDETWHALRRAGCSAAEIKRIDQEVMDRKIAVMVEVDVAYLEGKIDIDQYVSRLLEVYPRDVVDRLVRINIPSLDRMRQSH